MSPALPSLLVLLALVDGALIGFRAAAGRSGRVDKRAYYRRAVGLGARYAALGTVGGLLLAAVLTALRGPTLWADFVAAAAAALQIFGVFAALIVAALLIWLIPFTDLRTVVTLSILGPGTLLRPAVIVAGLAAGVFARPRWEVLLLAGYGGGFMLMLQGWLTRRYYPVDPALTVPSGRPE